MNATLQTNKIYEILQESDKRISVMQGGSRCFTGETLVKCNDGYKQIKDIEPGQLVYSIDNNYNTVLRKVVDKFIYKTDHSRHKVITFVLSDNKKITCTYGHKLLQEDGYIKADVIAKRMLERGHWFGWEVSSEQSWKVVGTYVQDEKRRRFSEDNEASEGCEWVSKDNDTDKWQLQDCEDAQNYSRDICAESRQQTTGKPYRQQQSEQLCGEFGVGDIQREYGSYDEAREADLQQWRKEWQKYPFREYCKSYTERIQTVCGNGEGFGEEVWGKDLHDKGYFEGEKLEKRCLDFNDIKEIIYHEVDEPVYDIEVEEFHNYFVTEENIISHNSGKTYNILIWFIVKLLQENGKTLTIVRQSLPSIKGSVLRDFVDILTRLNIYSEDNHNKTEQIYYLNGNTIEFVSADQPQKIRGRARTYLFCNEANELSYEAWMQLIMRTEGKIVIDYNPSDVASWIYDSVIPRDDADFNITTFRDNPFLPKELVDELERLKDADPNYWQIYGLGERGLSQDLIYTHYKTTEHMPEDGEVVYGLDFGFNVPSALVKVMFVEGAAYAQELLYETRLTTNDLVDRLKLLNIDPYDEIFCDAAEPKTIEELVRNGFNAKHANKDVTEGIRTIKGTPLFIQQDSVNLLKELKNYRWKTDRNGNKLDSPVKFGDHICFVGDTMITTINGLKRIDSITTNDLVLTSEGYRKVNKLFDNGVHLVEKYLMRFDTFEITLVCTPNHKVKTNKGWIEISKLKSGIKVYLNNFIEENHLHCHQEKGISTTEETKCIGGSGSMSIEEKDQKGITFTTLTETHGITELKTLNSLSQKNIIHTTSQKELRKIRNGLLNFRRKGLPKLQSGINRLKELNGTKNTQKTITLENKTMGWQNAYYVKRSITKKLPLLNTAIQTAKLKHFESEGSWKERVYDLSVDTTHEYFANGVLVHNCDALRYSIFSKLTIPKITWGAI